MNPMDKVMGIPQEIVHDEEAYSDDLVEKLFKVSIAFINLPRHDYPKYQQHKFQSEKSSVVEAVLSGPIIHFEHTREYGMQVTYIPEKYQSHK
jgi:hypothetical protein